MESKDLKNPTLIMLIRNAKYASSTIQNEINDAIEEAKTEDELIGLATIKLATLANEARNYKHMFEMARASL